MMLISFFTSSLWDQRGNGFPKKTDQEKKPLESPTVYTHGHVHIHVHTNTFTHTLIFTHIYTLTCTHSYTDIYSHITDTHIHTIHNEGH